MAMCSDDSFEVNETDYDCATLNGFGNESVYQHWFRYDLCGTVILCVAYGLVFFIGLIGNCLVVFVVLRTKPMRRSVTNVFLVNLAFADLLVVLACLPFTLVANLLYPWVLGPVICKLVPYLQGVSVCASVYTLVAIAMERYRTICQPLCIRLRLSHCRIIIWLIWIFAALLTLPWAIVFQLHPLDELRGIFDIEVCTEEWTSTLVANMYFVVAHLVLCYMAPLLIIAVCYALVWKRVWYRQIPSELSPHLHKLHNSKIRALRMLLAVVIAFTLAWLPLYCTFARIKLGPPLSDGQAEFWRNIVPFAQWLGGSNSCVNPILYQFLDPKFRVGFRTALRFPSTNRHNSDRQWNRSSPRGVWI